MESLITLQEALRLDRHQTAALHRRHLRPRVAALLQIVGADRPLVRAEGPYFWDDQGTRYTDFLGGYAALHLGHNHPRIAEAMAQVAAMPNLVEGLSMLAGALAHNLTRLAPGLQRVFFANSGAEVVDAAIKLARAATRRKRLLSCHNGFHGRTLGALSVMDRPAFRTSFEPLLPGVAFVPFGDAPALEVALRQRDVAAFIVEPIQAEAGIVVPPEGYLQRARALCSQYGTLLVTDEIQTGLGRTGAMFAVNHEAVVPDVLLLGKGLGGGVIPLSAVLTTDRLWRAAKGDTPQTPFHTSTYGASTRACAAGLATLEVLTQERLPERAASLGAYTMDRLRQLQRRQPLIADVRGRGLMIGVELASVTQAQPATPAGGLLNRLSKEYLAGLLIRELLTRHRIMTLNMVNNANMIRVEPPLTIGQEDIDYFVDSLEQALCAIHSFPRALARAWPLLVRAHFS